MEGDIFLPQPVSSPISVFLPPLPEFDFRSSENCAPNELGYVRWNEFNPPIPIKDSQCYRRFGCISGKNSWLHAFCATAVPNYNKLQKNCRQPSDGSFSLTKFTEQAESYIQKIQCELQLVNPLIYEPEYPLPRYPLGLRNIFSSQTCEDLCLLSKYFHKTIYILITNNDSLKKCGYRIGPRDQLGVVLISSQDGCRTEVIVRVDEHRLDDGAVGRRICTIFEPGEPLINWLN